MANDEELQRIARLQSVLSSPVLADEMKSRFDVVDSLDRCFAHRNVSDCVTHVLLARDTASGRLCVLKIFALDSVEKHYINELLKTDSAANNNFATQYACCIELSVLRVARQLLIDRATPCFPFLRSEFIVDVLDDDAHHIWPYFERCRQSHWASVPRLILCMDFLSRTTLRRWLTHHIVDSRHFHHHLDRQQDAVDVTKFLQSQLTTLFLHIFCALYCLQRADDILHNDLHLDNILMVSSSLSSDDAAQFAYVVENHHCVVRNDLGESLRQLPVICDFGMASSVSTESSQRVVLSDYYCDTQRCAYHNGARRRDSKCYQTAMCDVTRLLNDVFDHLYQCGAAYGAARMAIVMRAFASFDDLRLQLNLRRQTQCVRHDSLARLLLNTFAFNAAPITACQVSDICVYDCDAATDRYRQRVQRQ